MAPDGGERLERLTEAKRQSIQNLDHEPCEPCHQDAVNQNVVGRNIIAPSMQSVHSDHVDGALNDELVVAGIVCEIHNG